MTPPAHRRDAPAALAHRGFCRDGAENTLDAFRAARDLGYEWIETDVNTTADGVVLSFHDETLDRVTGGSGKVSALTWAQIRAERVAGAGRIPRFADLLTELPELKFNVDVKDEASVAALPALLHELGAVDRVRVTSFSESRRRRTLRRIRELDGRTVPTSSGKEGMRLLLVCSWLGGPTWRLARRAAARWIEPFDTVQIPRRYRVRGGAEVQLVTPRFLDFAHRHGIDVHVWTVNETAEMAELLELGVDGIVTDRADLLASLLAQRGQWPPSGV
ncbi:glycerophosphodiester phosphodiesterase family protein [Kocuria sp. CPCC 205258]|uniref:glycerophosphodiester phosphodiesterase family protein n=1 Tax=Kocuria TaxID=57493 RepID=UPI0003673D1F|nr:MULTISPECIES: glycerophosphodiester phosphodiesterase family protein [Kocuria]EYT55417.1 esterase [Kocuria sp. UCD-OTCP]MCC5782676.1 esterase [Kocuria sp. CCUG 69068]PAU90465.1 esterase [Kocuria sp. WN036]VEH42137.1 Glycerophosphoryl diester phosphodiesterase [Kocuria rosea]